MNRFLRDILDQPEALQCALDDCAGPTRASIVAAAELLRAAPALVVTSMGSALLSGMPVARALAGVHANVRLEESAELLRLPFDARPLYLVISRSGESGEVADLARRIRAHDGRLIAITMTATSTLARHADLVVRDAASFDGFICTKAFTSLALVGMLIAEQIAGGFDDRLRAELAQAFAAMRRASDGMVERMRSDAALGAATGITFLSEGAGMCLAQAGALWTEEAARIRASASSFAQFRHGPIEQVDTGFMACWIDLAPSTRTRAMHAELVAKGATVRVVSVPGGYPDACEFPVADLPEPFRMLAPALAVQLIAWRIASARGLEPGEMRYLEWVVK